MARERTVKDTPKRGKLTDRQIQRAVEKVIYARLGGGEARQTHHVTTIKVGRDARTGRFITCKEAERRKATAVVETIKIPKKNRSHQMLIAKSSRVSARRINYGRLYPQFRKRF